MTLQQSMFDGIIVDNFAGGGGASTGIRNAIGRDVDIAINHDPAAIAMHRANHPYTQHFCESVWENNPQKAAQGRPVSLAWFSPDCTHFSKAKGAKPVKKSIRGLSWVVLRWAMEIRPRVIMLENVEEIKTWGPLVEVNDGFTPDPNRKGETFQGFIQMLSIGISASHPAFIEACEFLEIDIDSDKAQMLIDGLGYDVDYRELRACDYGAPTIRKRFFMVARCDGRPIVWPAVTHGDPESEAVRTGRLKPWRTAAEIIDWSLPCPSIFDTADEIRGKYELKAVRPLADNTLKRIAKGTDKFVLKNPGPFILRVNYSGSNHHYCNSITDPLPTITSKNGWGFATPFLSQYHSYESDGARGQVLDRPLLTIDTNPRYAITAALLTKYYSNEKYGCSIKEPIHTITSKDRVGLVEAHLCVLRNNQDCKDLTEPMPTVMTSPGHFAEIRTVLTRIDSSQDLGYWPEIRSLLNKYCGYTLADDEIILLEIDGVLYFISDIGMRMLAPRELFNAQGFPGDYIIDRDANGKAYPKSAQVARCGNAVPPIFAEVLVRANLPDICRRAA